MNYDCKGCLIFKFNRDHEMHQSTKNKIKISHLNVYFFMIHSYTKSYGIKCLKSGEIKTLNVSLQIIFISRTVN